MRKNLLLGALTVFGIGLAGNLSAQTTGFQCGNAEMLRKLYAENPELEADYYNLLEKNKHIFTNEKGIKTVEYTIPIVFHILHEYGSENISDAQVYDQVDILNEDYHNLAPDNNTAQAPFDTIIGNANIKFVLAKYDPLGNCTNGIEHIYTHMANKGDDYSKLHQWNRKQYLNVWVTNSIGSAGVAGYAYYPSATVGSFFFADGIIILNDYIGSIGTSNPGSSRALTHEIGHWLGLSHTWGSTNDPNVACGDDQVPDTPMTKGSDLVCNYNFNTCNDSVVGSYWFPHDVKDNVQNYMDYSYCSMMFTRDQVELMRNNLNESTAFRNNLWQDSTLMITGADLPEPGPLCIPIPDFTVNRKMACIGDNITFQNASSNAAVDTYSWSFPGATPATSSATNPVVTYAASGFYEASLTVTNAAGSATKTIPYVVYISPGWTEHIGPYNETFNTGSDFWISQNPEDNDAYFYKVNSGGKDNSPCYVLQNYKDVSNAEPYSDDWFYYQRLGYSKDYLVTAAYDLSTTSSVTVSFDYAYGTKATTLADITEKLVVSSSTDCGKTWQTRKTIVQDDLLTVGYVEGNFIPASNNEYKTATFNLTTTGADVHTRFRFEFTASDYSSNLYIENFNVTGVLGIAENGLLSTIAVSPNPVASGNDIQVEINGDSKGLVLEVIDLNGALVSTTAVAESNGTQIVNIPMNVAKGFYLINAVQGSSKTTHRVAVY